MGGGVGGGGGGGGSQQCLSKSCGNQRLTETKRASLVKSFCNKTKTAEITFFFFKRNA